MQIAEKYSCGADKNEAAYNDGAFGHLWFVEVVKVNLHILGSTTQPVVTVECLL